MSEISETEAKAIIDAMEKLGVKPKADTPADFEAWMKDYVTSKGAGPVKTETTEATTKTVISTHSPQVPNLPPFSGTTRPGTNDTTYEDWKFNVTSLMSDGYHKESVIMQAVRRSLRGQASGVLRRLGTNAHLSDVIHKMDQMYGTIETEEDILKEFYNAEQQDDDVNTWSCRLEEILYKANIKLSLTSTKMNEMLRNKFWTGLRKELKDVSGHKFDRIKDFDELRVSIREIEMDQQKNQTETPKKPQPSKMATTHDNKPQESEFGKLKGLMVQMRKDFSTLQQQVLDLQSQQQQTCDENQQCYRQQFNKRPADSQQQQPFKKQQYQQQQQQQQWSQGYRDTSHGYLYSEPSYREEHNTQFRGRGRGNVGRGNRKDIQCYRCYYYGHIAADCRVNLDHRRRQNLNNNQPIGRGRR